MLLAYLAYLLLRQGIEDPDRRARFGAIYSIFAFLSVPLTFMSIRLFRTIHPVVVGSGDPTATGAFDMTPEMRTAFFFSLLTFTFVYITLVWYRVRLEQFSKKVAEMKMKVLARS
jgi:heme exporter protein C